MAPKKLTLSCSRCRASKLKCDRKEPCLECVKRDCVHLCTKDERQPRAKRTKSQHIEQSRSQVSPEEEAPEVEETAQILEQFVDVIPLPTSGVAPDISNRYWESQDPQRRSQKLGLIRDVVQALPEWDLVEVLYEVFVTRCQGPLGSVVHTPSFMKQADKLRHCLSMASPDTAIASMLSMDVLASLVLALVLGLAFYPTPSLLGVQLTPLTFRVEQLRASDEPAATWRSLGVRCLQGNISLFCGSISSLQAAIMLLLDTKETSLELDAVLVTAISGARKLGLHRLGKADLNVSPSLNYGSEAADPPEIRTEVAIRIWWTLVMRDWSRGQALGYYTIRPSQFNTRMPLHINDDDLLGVHGKIADRPRSEFTMLSYTIHALELSVIVRESIDLGDIANEASQRRQHLNQKYEKYVANLPSYFRLGSTVGLTAMGPMAAIPVQRFMLHQQLWSLLLRLHRATLSTPMGRASCQQLAHNIINTQAQIQARCTICGSLSSNETQLFNATVVLVLGLLFDSPSTEAERTSAQLSRLMTRDHIREAIELLRTKASPDTSSGDSAPRDLLESLVSRSVAVLEALMKLEDNSGDDITHLTGPDKKHSLYPQVVGILKSLNVPTAPIESPASGLSTSTPDDTSLTLSMPVADGFPDLDVMPILSNGLSPDMWDFFDFKLLEDVGKENSPTAGDIYGASSYENILYPTQSSSLSGGRFAGESPYSLESRSEPASNSAMTPSSADAFEAANFFDAMGTEGLPPW
ncbi:uncharacterized protein N7511_007811 [Penicillium nucicola]|uniref:uncharacterized protein n=1 Tax=Penicillium nucicola TaxID=1850975 RepID=UPI00254573EE|nr:uncharacterized protein N7511_007811 [Penicillium nucicola]KAJ5753658.1 hypothetical protein N7511_007811 [Penicillium nucicola]